MSVKSIVLNVYSDPSHGWVKVPCQLLMTLGLEDKISACSYLNGAHAYVEEDGDASKLLKALKDAGYQIEFRERTTRSKECRIRQYTSYSATGCRERAERPKPAPGILADFGGTTYTLVQDLKRKGWEVQTMSGVRVRMKAQQLARARLRMPAPGK